MGSSVVRLGREQRQQDASDDEGDHVTQIAEDKRPPAAETIDEHHAAELPHQGDYRVDGLIPKRVVTLDADLIKDLDRVIPVRWMEN